MCHLALPALPDLARIPPLISRAQRTGFAAATKLYEKSKDLQSAESQLYEGEELYVKAVLYETLRKAPRGRQGRR